MNRKSKGIFYFSLFLSCFAFILYRAQYGVDTYHESVILKPSLDVTKGRILFRETFTHYGQMNTYFNALSIVLFGPTLYSVRIGIAFAYSISFSLLFFLSYKLFDFISAVACAMAFFLLLPFIFRNDIFLSWSTVYCIPLQLTLCSLILFMNKKRVILFSLIMGFILTILFHTRQPMGGLSFLILIFTLLFLIMKGFIIRKKSLIKLNFIILLFMIAGFIITNLIIVLHMIYNESFEHFFFQNIRWALFGGATHTILSLTAFDNLFPDFKISLLFFTFLSLLKYIYKLNKFLFALLFLLTLFSLENLIMIDVPNLFPYFLIFLAVQYLVTGRFKKLKIAESKGILLLALATASWINFHPNSSHLLNSFLPFIFIIPLWINQEQESKLSKHLFILLFVFIIIYRLISVYRQAQIDLAQYDKHQHQTGVFKGIYLKTEISTSLNNLDKSFLVAKRIRGQDPNPPILNTSSNPYISMLTENPWNYDPNNFFWIGLPFKLWEKEDEYLTELKKINPIIVTVEDIHSPIFELKIKKLGYQLVSTASVSLNYTPSKIMKFWVINGTQ